ncbi:hypothetical protein PO883_17565 [Massilia sp. DJPM01]|uniref:hypothetical protein n=1 Tax=Massilia sp. DJPM01 TaxID=3024404 RepID=UPI00259EF487|nr:hypothetical protein [Massilia sp. DJPM01]MDM5179007.1 hypothetical protein [Massilia sp. DJPM01]
MDSAIKEKVIAVAGSGRNAAEWTAYFRVTLGLYYLAGLMTSDTIDFKKVDRAFNQFIYHTIGKGHTITSVLQFMSGAKVVPVVSAPRFIAAFTEHCPDVPPDTIPFLLQLNLGVAKNISGIDVAGPLLDWIERQTALATAGGTDDGAPAMRAAGDPPGPDVL